MLLTDEAPAVPVTHTHTGFQSRRVSAVEVVFFWGGRRCFFFVLLIEVAFHLKDSLKNIAKELLTPEGP